MAVITLGINAAFHDTAAALLADGVPLAAAEEERFTRIKHGKRPVPFSAWELPYHAIDYCLREVLTRFEPGAQGRHKIARGFLPTLVRSRHRIGDPRFARAIGDWCAEERLAVRQHAQDLQSHSPFRSDPLP